MKSESDGGVRDKGTAEPPSLALHPRRFFVSVGLVVPLSLPTLSHNPPLTPRSGPSPTEEDEGGRVTRETTPATRLLLSTFGGAV